MNDQNEDLNRESKLSNDFPEDCCCAKKILTAQQLIARTRNQVVFVGLVIAVLALNACLGFGWIEQGSAHCQREAQLDFFAYLLPLVAAVLAGGGLYFKHNQRHYFVASLYVLAMGVMFYFAVHSTLYGVLITTTWFVVVAAVAVLVSVVARGYTEKRAWRLGAYSLLLIALAASVVWAFGLLKSAGASICGRVP